MMTSADFQIWRKTMSGSVYEVPFMEHDWWAKVSLSGKGSIISVLIFRQPDRPEQCGACSDKETREGEASMRHTGITECPNHRRQSAIFSFPPVDPTA